MNTFRTAKEWQKLLKESEEKPVIIYKHSSTCPISAGAYQKLLQGIADKTITEPIHMIVVQDTGDLKMTIAEDTGVVHQSPQIIILKDRKSIYNESHHAITPESVAEHMS